MHVYFLPHSKIRQELPGIHAQVVQAWLEARLQALRIQNWAAWGLWVFASPPCTSRASVTLLQVLGGSSGSNSTGTSRVEAPGFGGFSTSTPALACAAASCSSLASDSLLEELELLLGVGTAGISAGTDLLGLLGGIGTRASDLPVKTLRESTCQGC